ncbi:type II secretion system ATPase GspE [Marinibactrum halimedae]|uniref:Type II secretion system protein E n=1 Tax=Marinibactrum halimedae TaxID=1444977 RepID=A0AA37T5D0_9GAMM|nr:type II secretion system ATPase GspE [Marinibactrum halimedae]MCD9458254.1 type II secretion system ATPase GspE [Marinibactrum halimedae]GLS27119.1 type II secretion system protein GspE [Marinibactrum halimedae]
MSENAEQEIVETEVEEFESQPLTDSDLPFYYASQHGVIFEDGVLSHRSPLPLPLLLEIRRFLNTDFDVEKIEDSVFQKRLKDKYHGASGSAQQAADQMADEVGSDIDLGSLADELSDDQELLSGNDDAPVIKLINAILSQAVREKASDIHIEPYEDRVAVRFRVDGVLNEMLSPKAVLAPLLVSRLKVMAKLDIAEKRLPQDGRISVKLAGHGLDIRLSTIPSAHGERVVLRLLDTTAGQLTLDQIAMPPQVRNGFSEALHKPHGIILVTGPTGSGKTTTLYAGLSHINERSRNILTIEDPVEYALPGIGQTQVNAKIDMTFARGLRAILRQDPDVVMIGEIRDQETAAIAVQASLTGHLVMSTLHTNTAIGAVTRLQDMGIEPFLLSSSLTAVMSQRLVRTLCSCKRPDKPTPAEQLHMGIGPDETIYRPVGCEACHHQGYRGRSAIYEWIDITPEMRQMIHEDVGEQEMTECARKYSDSITTNGCRRVLAGETSIEEVMRVTTAV